MANAMCARCGVSVNDLWDFEKHGEGKCKDVRFEPKRPMVFSDIKSFEVVSEPGEVRYHLTEEGALRVYIGKGLAQAPPSTSSAHILPGYTTFIIREAP